MAATVHSLLGCLVFVSVLHGVHSAGNGNDIVDVLNELRQRIESLEARDAIQNAKIAEMDAEISGLKKKIENMEIEHKQKEASMHDQMRALKEMDIVAEPNAVKDTDEEQLNGNNEDSDRSPSRLTSLRKKRISFRNNRSTPETDVAFYATHTEHVIHHLGKNQALLFQQAVTNVGNAYNNNSGSFVAPVGGTYVFHVTLMGIDATNHGHVYAHIDVNGIMHSRLGVTPYDQSSQMLVISLKPGDTVSVRNDVNDNGFIGQHFSTFSGFLLYQTFPMEVTNIIG